MLKKLLRFACRFIYACKAGCAPRHSNSGRNFSIPRAQKSVTCARLSSPLIKGSVIERSHSPSNLNARARSCSIMVDDCSFLGRCVSRNQTLSPSRLLCAKLCNRRSVQPSSPFGYDQSEFLEAAQRYSQIVSVPSMPMPSSETR